jgi:hypothetical protein
MRMRILLATLLAAVVGFGTLPGLPARAAETKYDFEKCQQGWEAKKGSNWTRSKDHPGSSNTTQAMSNVLYHTDESRGDTLVSKPHVWPGGKAKVKFRARWQFEWYPDESLTLDRAAFEVSTDGGKSWKSRAGFRFPNANFPEFSNVEVDVDAPAGPVMFRFVLFSDTSVEMFGLEVDDISIPTAAPDGIGCK